MLVNCVQSYKFMQNGSRRPVGTLLGRANRDYKYNHFANISSQVAIPQPMAVPFFKDKESEFIGYLPKVLKSLTPKKTKSELAPAAQKLVNLLEYNVPIGEKIKGVTTVVSYKMLEKTENLTEENVELANILGWCAEFLEAADTMAEDIINNSETRRNVPCWFRLPIYAQTASLDVLTVDICTFNLLKIYFSKHPFYTHMIHFFRTVFNRTAAGRILDSQQRKVDQLNIDEFHRLTEYKTGYDVFHIGVTLGMYLSRIYDPGLHTQVTPLLMDMGRYFQIRKYVQGSLGNATMTENLSKDIGEGKCSWLVATALQKSNPFQRKIIEKNYGRREDEAIEEVLNLYKSLDMSAEFCAYEEDSYKTLCINIDKLENIPIRNLLSMIVKQLYNR
ncbi:farnesyl pyrophosphate synthase-like [Anoplophora glabripennis]|uniref:farnesyl pyrophosphate synthase-like n=1 Tax=Anoplophora glabripennis TaxID=217634 RepID=UPI0008750EC0|nr:farnesyl pyrophosphate synthase-like [Anoplophora glabripennis]